jgi:hypothetical protein
MGLAAVRWAGALLAVALIGVAAPALASADGIGGATYTGTASDGASVTFTVSSDGTIVESYSIEGIDGTDVNGRGCTLITAGAAGVWPGAPIAGGSFDWSIGTEFDFQGTFGVQSASGSFLIDNPAIGASAGCSTGTVGWTATTTATPPPSGGSSPPGGSTAPDPSSGSSGAAPSGATGSSGSSGSSGPSSGGTSSSSSQARHRKSVATKVAFTRHSASMLDGRIKAQDAACVTRRTVYLWRGRKRVGHTRASRTGRFSFKVSRGLRGRAVRAAVTPITTKSVTCAAGSSPFVGG